MSVCNLLKDCLMMMYWICGKRVLVMKLNCGLSLVSCLSSVLKKVVIKVNIWWFMFMLIIVLMFGGRKNNLNYRLEIICLFLFYLLIW